MARTMTIMTLVGAAFGIAAGAPLLSREMAGRAETQCAMAPPLDFSSLPADAFADLDALDAEVDRELPCLSTAAIQEFKRLETALLDHLELVVEMVELESELVRDGVSESKHTALAELIAADAVGNGDHFDQVVEHAVADNNRAKDDLMLHAGAVQKFSKLVIEQAGGNPNTAAAAIQALFKITSANEQHSTSGVGRSRRGLWSWAKKVVKSVAKAVVDVGTSAAKQVAKIGDSVAKQAAKVGPSAVKQVLKFTDEVVKPVLNVGRTVGAVVGGATSDVFGLPEASDLQDGLLVTVLAAASLDASPSSTQASYGNPEMRDKYFSTSNGAIRQGGWAETAGSGSYLDRLVKVPTSAIGMEDQFESDVDRHYPFIMWRVYTIKQGLGRLSGKKVMAFQPAGGGHKMNTQGWQTMIGSERVKQAIKKAVEGIQEETPDYITGFSLGGVLAESACSYTGVPGASFGNPGPWSWNPLTNLAADDKYDGVQWKTVLNRQDHATYVQHVGGSQSSHIVRSENILYFNFGKMFEPTSHNMRGYYNAVREHYKITV